MPLTEIEVRTAKVKEKPYKLTDGGWLFLLVNPTGSKLWRLSYRFNGKQKLLSLGAYPHVGLKDARARRDNAKALLSKGVDPGEQKKIDARNTAQAGANTFGVLADELLDKKQREGRSEATLVKLRWIFDLVRPVIGERPVAELTSADILAALRPIETRGRLETARRVRSNIGEVFRYAIATGRAENDPTAALKGALASPVVKHRPAITEPKAFGGLLRAIDSYDGMPETCAALKLIPLVFVRPGELRTAEWKEIDFDKSLWTIPAPKTKTKRIDHLVYLPPQAIAILRELKKITGDGKFLFPSVRSRARCMSENTVNGALRRLGYTKEEVCGHGFRASASSILNESGLWNPDAIERQLAHIDNDSIRRAYARAEYWDERVRMMGWWADKCDELRRGGHVIPMRAGA
ncbi:MAG: integrase arm-type DNA-binding domain-containing protein [Alphaproteobacteria bacterium]|nr:integrase arm-type DNA-binding domain-containing protein [Alphaproteobacteria bacterium]